MPSVNARVTKSVRKVLTEIIKLYKSHEEGMQKYNQEVHVQYAILNYAKSLKECKVKPGDDVKAKLGL